MNNLLVKKHAVFLPSVLKKSVRKFFEQIEIHAKIEKIISKNLGRNKMARTFALPIKKGKANKPKDL
jgi:hypothetical protein